MDRQDNNLIIGMLGIILFLLVISVLHIFLLFNKVIEINNLQVLIPFVVFTGFFIFLIGAMLIALAIFKSLVGFK
jgi:hypothetical protein